MKILHVLYSGMGGHGNVFFSMVTADTTQVFEYEALFNGIEDVRTEYTERCKAQNIKWSFVKKRSGLDMGFYKNLVVSVKRSDADIIFLHGSTHVLWARLGIMLGQKKRRLIVRETQANHLKTKQDWLWLMFAMVLANKLVILSEAYRHEIQEKLSWIYFKKKIVVIPNGIDTQKFNWEKDNTGPHIVIGMQSRIVNIKDHSTLLQAFAYLLQSGLYDKKKPVLKIAGDGDRKAQLEIFAKELGIEKQVVFTGMLSEDELVYFLQELDIYVHASYGETMSTAIMQAMACRKAIIASDVPGINNMLIHNNTGLLVPVENATAMYEAFNLLLNDSIFSEQIATNAYSFAIKNYSNAMMFNNYKKIFIY